jgi:FAD-dependent urate hydroxylase
VGCCPTARPVRPSSAPTCTALAHPQEAFARFEAVRRTRVEGIIKWAARINNSEAAGPVARVFRDATLPLILKLTANSKAQAEIYDHHIVW